MTRPVRGLTLKGDVSFAKNLAVDQNGAVSSNNASGMGADTQLSTVSTFSEFGSLLFEVPTELEFVGNQEDQSLVSDLNLDLIVNAIAAGREEPDFLTRYLYHQLHDGHVMYYRQEIFRDLEDGILLEALEHFAQKIHQVRVHAEQIEKMQYRHQQEGWFLDEIAIYCEAVTSLAGHLGICNIRSKGLSSFREYLSKYVASAAFTSLDAETRNLEKALGAIKYSVRIKGLKVEVRRYDGELDYSFEIEKTFERFQQGSVKDYKVNFRGWPGMNHVGAQIVGLLARLFSDEFSALDDYCRRHAGFFDENIRRFDRELQFYIAYLEFIKPLRLAGLEFCYPEISEESKEIFAIDTFDLALANKLVSERATVILNEFHLEEAERVLVISGPNQGGKTTFARTFGQLHHFASIGCPVPGSAARLFLFDKIFTHFEREEDLANMSGKLENDLVRIRGVLEEATTNSIVIMNEIFTSTTLYDARFLGTKIMERVIDLDLLCVYVTFIDEIASLGKTIVSMKSTIIPENPAERTYKVVRGPADGLAYALAIAEKHNLTYERMRRRIAR
jgi:hypothetical protein